MCNFIFNGVNLIFYIICVTISLWLIFFGGAERIQNTLLGYFEFGPAAENTIYIRALAWMSLIFFGGLLIQR